MQRKRRQSDPANRVWLAIALLGVIAIFVLFGLLLKKTEYSAGASDVSSTNSAQPTRDAVVNDPPPVEVSDAMQTVDVGNLAPESEDFREQWHRSKDVVSVSSPRARDPNPCHEVVDWQSGTYIDNCSRGEGYETQSKRMQTKNPDRAGVDQVIQSTPEI